MDFHCWREQNRFQCRGRRWNSYWGERQKHPSNGRCGDTRNVWILTTPVQQGLPLVDPNFYSQSKENKGKADGLGAAAAEELSKLMSDPPGPGGPGDHHKKEIKAILDRAKRIAERLTGKNKADRLKQIEEIEKAASQR